MAVRIRDAIKTAQSVDELVELVTTKRYTKARVRRLLAYLVQAIESDYCAIHIPASTERQTTSQVFEHVSTKSAELAKNPDAMTQSRPDLPTRKSKYGR